MGLLVILWNILKIIGFIVLALFVFVVVMVLLILLSPICYQVAGTYTECVSGKFDIKWILGAIHAYGVYNKEGLQFSLRLFGCCVYGADKKKKYKKEDKYTQEDVMLSSRSREQQQENLEDNIIYQKEEVVKEEIKQEVKEKIEPEIQQQKEAEREIKKKKIEQKHSRQKTSDIEKESKKRNKKNKIKKGNQKRVKNKKIKKKEKDDGKTKLNVNYFLNMENKKELLQGVFVFCKRMLKGVVPKHCCLSATIGTGDPALTGYILAAIGALKIKFGKGLEITGDFTQKIIKDVFLDIKGRILLAYLFYAIVKLILVKPVWEIIKVVWKGYR